MSVAPLSTNQEMTSLRTAEVADSTLRVIQVAPDACSNIPRVSTDGPEAAVPKILTANTAGGAEEDAGGDVAASEATYVGATETDRATATVVNENHQETRSQKDQHQRSGRA